MIISSFGDRLTGLAVYRSSRVGMADLYKEIAAKLSHISARDTMPVGVLVTVPVALGARFPDGQYLLFSNATPAGPMWQDLQDAQGCPYRGRLFYALLDDFVTPDAVLWDRCSVRWRHLFAGVAFCQAEWALDGQYPGASAAFLAGRQPPQGWTLFGWAIGERWRPLRLADPLPVAGTQLSLRLHAPGVPHP